MSSNVKEIVYSLYILDTSLNVISIDEKFTKLTGYTNKDIKDNKLNQMDLIPKEDADEYLKMVQEKLVISNEAYIEHRMIRKDGTTIFVFCLGCLNEDGTSTIRVIDMSNSLTMISKSRKIENKYNNKMKKLVVEATTDNLTGLLRRDTFKYKIENYIKNKVKSAYIMLDIDNFKNINDVYGHDVGDRILKETANIFTRVVNDNGIVCRFGGDEFAIYLLNMERKKEVIDYLEKIREEVSNISIREDKNFKMSLSMGVLYIDKFKKELLFDDIYKESDVLLYTSKKNGKDQYTIKNKK